MDKVEELGEEIAVLSARLDAATHRLLECIRRFDEAGGWNEQGAVSCAHWLAWRLGWDAATAREKVRVARALGRLPGIDQALSAATLSYAKVRALTRVATPDNEAKLLEMALVATGAQLERLCRGYRSVLDGKKSPAPEERSVRTRLLPGGMVRLELVLEPDEADLILRALDRAREVHAMEAESRESEASPAPGAPEALLEGSAEAALPVGVSAETSWPSRADGAVQIAEAFLAGHPVTGTGGERCQVMIHVDQEVLGPDGAWAATLEDGTRVSAETLRRVACDCGLLVVGHERESLGIGRRTRTIPPAIRRALMQRDRGCVFPGCTHGRFLHAHHVKHWLNGGRTSMDNLVILCSFHHSLVPEGGWTVAADPDGVFTFHAPTGKRVAPVPPYEVCGDETDWLREWADLGLTMPRWDGKTPDYRIAVECLLEAG